MFAHPLETAEWASNLPEDRRRSRCRDEDAIESSGMDTEGAGNLADGLSFTHGKDSCWIVTLSQSTC